MELTHNQKRHQLILAKHPKSKAMEKIKLHKPRMLSEAESKAKTAHWPKGKERALTNAQRVDYQKRIGRAYSE